MNDSSTPITPTEAHKKLADTIIQAAHDWYKSHSKGINAARLIAESEARAVCAEQIKTAETLRLYGAQFGESLADYCKRRKAERDQLRSEVEQLRDEIVAIGTKPMFHQPESFAARRAEEIQQEREREVVTSLRSEVERLKNLGIAAAKDGIAHARRAERAEAELATERARNAGLVPLLARWLKMADDCHHEQQEVGYSEYNVTAGLMCDTRAAIDAAMKEDGK